MVIFIRWLFLPGDHGIHRGFELAGSFCEPRVDCGHRLLVSGRRVFKEPGLTQRLRRRGTTAQRAVGDEPSGVERIADRFLIEARG